MQCSPPTLTEFVIGVCTGCFETIFTIHGPNKSGGFSSWDENIVGIFLADKFSLVAFLEIFVTNKRDTSLGSLLYGLILC